MHLSISSLSPSYPPAILSLAISYFLPFSEAKVSEMKAHRLAACFIHLPSLGQSAVLYRENPYLCHIS